MSSVKAPKRVVVLGSSCAGKTTFSLRLASALKANHIELDALHWEPNWKQADDNVFRARVRQAIASDSWVVDGNYSKVHDLIWPQADTLIWLDPPLPVVLRRFFFRALSRSFKGEMLWGHSKETLRSNIFSRNSLLVWILTTYKRRSERYLELMNSPPEGTTFYHFRNENQIATFWQDLEP
jgi:adenylate kinase family enzyme